MSQPSTDPSQWRGLRDEARAILETRDYSQASPAERLATAGLPAGEVAEKRGDLEAAGAWIPGVEVFPRRIFAQNHRGFFGEFAREGEGVLGAIKMWPKQWATARMYAGTAKGFHIHPPHIPDGEDPAAWFQNLFAPGADVGQRPYAREQWDAMFFIQGIAEMLLVDEPTASLDPKTSRQIMRLLQELCRERGLAAIINIHDVALAQLFAERIVGLRSGEIVYDGPPEDVSADVLTRIYGEEDWSQTIRLPDEDGETEMPHALGDTGAVDRERLAGLT